MIAELPPAFIMLFGALLVPFLRGRLRSAALLLIPVLSFVHLLGFSEGSYAQITLFDHPLIGVRIDRLALVFGYIFHIAAFLGILFSLHVKDTTQHVSVLLYAGASIGAVFAGDLVTLFVYWELTAVSSVFLVWARRTERSYSAGMRYLVMAHLEPNAWPSDDFVLLNREISDQDDLYVYSFADDELRPWVQVGRKAVFPVNVR